jgi:glutathione synthase
VGSTADGKGRVSAWAAPVTVRRPEGRSHFTLGDFANIDLGADIDVVLMRQDPPFDLGYITGAHLLEKLKGTTLVVNDPAEVRNAPEKVFVLDFARFMPPTLVARRIEDVRDFQKRMVAAVSAAIWSSSLCTAMAARRCFACPPAATIWAPGWRSSPRCGATLMVQPFLPDVSKGDKRIVLVDGEVAGAINRKPGEGEFRSTLPWAAAPRRPASPSVRRKSAACLARNCARAGVCRHRCDRRAMADRNQRDFAHRDCRHRSLQQ